MIPSQMAESPGTLILGLIMDTLSGRSPLYRLDKFFENQDTELLLDKNANATAFRDYNGSEQRPKSFQYARNVTNHVKLYPKKADGKSRP